MHACRNCYKENTMSDVNAARDTTPLQITPLERVALQLLAEAKTKADLTGLFTRMGVATATDAVDAAIRRGLIVAGPPTAQAESDPRLSGVPLPKNFGVVILARIRSSSSTVTRSRPLLRQDSSTALTTIPRTNAGIFFMRAAAASSQAIVGADSPPYSINGGVAPKPRRGEGGPESSGPRSARSGDPANFPGVWVQRGSSAIRSPVIP